MVLSISYLKSLIILLNKLKSIYQFFSYRYVKPLLGTFIISYIQNKIKIR